MSCGRICQREVSTAGPGESVREAARHMAQRNVGTLVVLDTESKPVGILTDRDIVTRIVAEGRDPERTPLEGIMTLQPRTLPEPAPIESALVLMRRGAFRRVPIVDGQGRLVGLVSLDDVLAVLAEEFRSIGALVEHERPRTMGRI